MKDLTPEHLKVLCDHSLELSDRGKDTPRTELCRCLFAWRLATEVETDAEQADHFFRPKD